MTIVYEFHPKNCIGGMYYRTEYTPKSKADEERVMKLLKEQPERYKLIEIRRPVMKKSELLTKLASLNPRSAWNRGVRQYAVDMVEAMDGEEFQLEELLNGAKDWKEYSEGGCALIWDEEIAERLCTPSELRRTKYWCRNPNKNETWIDVQTRALRQAYILITEIAS